MDIKPKLDSIVAIIASPTSEEEGESSETPEAQRLGDSPLDVEETN